MAEWDSEIDVDEGLARALIREQFPSLDARSLRRVGEGWDNTVWATGEGIAFRFPRRAIAIPGIEREIALLPELARRLPAPVPDAAHVGTPSAAFPWPWFGSVLIEGTEIADAGLSTDRRVRLAGDLGAFLASLHAVTPSAAARLPTDPMGRAEMATRIPRARAALDQITSLCHEPDRVEQILAAAQDAPPDRAPVLVHGDLNLRHALISPTGALAGVIDWGDTCLAPRSVDLPLYWSLFDRQARTAFQNAYGPLSQATLAHARVLALFMDATLAAYAHDKGMHNLQNAALDGLRHTITNRGPSGHRTGPDLPPRPRPSSP